MFDEERAVLQKWEQQFQDKITELEAENQRLREQVSRITRLLDLPLQKQRILTAAYLAEWGELKAENQKLKDALNEIRSPIEYMEKRLAPNEKLNGIGAVMLANSAPYLVSIAEKALKVAEGK